MKIDVESLRVGENEKLSLAERPTSVEPLYASKHEYSKGVADHVRELEALHERLYASGRHALLIVLQGMDTAGKDGAIRYMMTGVNPQGCKVVSFKTPTPEEARHDFLWRAQRELPERGAIGVFNRSYYEAVLIERVHPTLLLTEGLVVPAGDREAFWETRMRSIRDFERHLDANGTRVVKIFLHISRDEQRHRLLRRLDDPEKVWKASRADVKEREFWRDYQHAYETALGATSTAKAPWHVVPADDKKNARLFVSRIVIEALSALSLKPPPLDAARKAELKDIRAALEE